MKVGLVAYGLGMFHFYLMVYLFINFKKYIHLHHFKYEKQISISLAGYVRGAVQTGCVSDAAAVVVACFVVGMIDDNALHGIINECKVK